MMKYSDTLYSIIDSELAGFQLPDSARVYKLYEKIKKADKFGEISTINRTFYKSIKPDLKKPSVTLTTLELLDKANIYTWLAYSLYDEVLDENAITLISPANIILREAYSLYLNAGVPKEIIDNLFSIVDSSNNLEIKLRNTSKPNLDDLRPLLSGKSIAHCLGQYWLLSNMNYPAENSKAEGFEKYCAARQLNDDLFDWRDDITRNHYTYASIYLANGARVSVPLSGKQELQALNQFFWDSGLEFLCREVITLCEESFDSLSYVLKDESPYLSLFITPIKQSASAAIENHLKNKKKLEKAIADINAQ